MTGLPQPRAWFLMSYCFGCWHVRKDHVDDGPCAYIAQLPGVLISCPCQAMAPRPA